MEHQNEPDETFAEPIEGLTEPEGNPGDAAAFDAAFADDGEGSDAAGERVEGDIAALQSRLERITDEREEIHDRLLRTLADFQNFRRRKEQESIQVRRQAIEGFAIGLIPVLDSFARAVAALDRGASVESVRAGLAGVERQLSQALEAQGVRRIESVGKPFDPHLHEALGAVASEEHAPETVGEEIEAGYTLGDRVIRPARVRVVS